jgi:hypothetical protein
MNARQHARTATADLAAKQERGRRTIARIARLASTDPRRAALVARIAKQVVRGLYREDAGKGLTRARTAKGMRRALRRKATTWTPLGIAASTCQWTHNGRTCDHAPAYRVEVPARLQAFDCCAAHALVVADRYRTSGDEARLQYLPDDRRGPYDHATPFWQQEADPYAPDAVEVAHLRAQYDPGEARRHAADDRDTQFGFWPTMTDSPYRDA